MQPTMELRWKQTKKNEDGSGTIILQQKWAMTYRTESMLGKVGVDSLEEWRDVPVVGE